jgi:ABC-type uncharacterized transport system permease subunit
MLIKTLLFVAKGSIAGGVISFFVLVTIKLAGHSEIAWTTTVIPLIIAVVFAVICTLIAFHIQDSARRGRR